MTAEALTEPEAQRQRRHELDEYARPHLGRSGLDFATSIVPYLLICAFMYVALKEELLSYWLVLPLAIPAAGFLLRTYILFHDCAHGSFLPWKKANVWLGTTLGLFVYSAFLGWRHNHAVHHATAGDLDRRGVGRHADADGRRVLLGLAPGADRLLALPPPARDVRHRACVRADGPAADGRQGRPRRV